MGKKEKSEKSDSKVGAPNAKPEAPKPQDAKTATTTPRSSKPAQDTTPPATKSTAPNRRVTAASKPTATKPVAKPQVVKKTSPAATSKPTKTKKAAVEPSKKSDGWSVGRILTIATFLVIVGIAVGISLATYTNNTATTPNNAAAAHTTTPNTSASITPTTAGQPELDPRFVQKNIGVGALYRVIGTGLPGHTAKQFSDSVLRFSGHSAQALAIYANAVHLWPNPNSTKGLLTPNGTYLSQKGIMLWSALQGALSASGTKKTVGQAPSNWYNTGVDSGKFGRSAVAGISGNRTSLIVTFKDGSKVVIMRRCGNLALPGKGTVPIVKTELQPKNWRLDPYAQGNAPIGGGQNKNPGPGILTTKPPKPGSTPRPNPAAPTPAATAIPGGSTPDPTASTPSPEPSAPTPTNPATGTIPIPGG